MLPQQPSEKEYQYSYFVGAMPTPSNELKRPYDPRMAVIQDMCEEDTRIRMMAEKYIGEMDAQGDSYGVPPLSEVVESLIKYFTRKGE